MSPLQMVDWLQISLTIWQNLAVTAGVVVAWIGLKRVKLEIARKDTNFHRKSEWHYIMRRVKREMPVDIWQASLFYDLVAEQFPGNTEQQNLDEITKILSDENSKAWWANLWSTKVPKDIR